MVMNLVCALLVAVIFFRGINWSGAHNSGKEFPTRSIFLCPPVPHKQPGDLKAVVFCKYSLLWWNCLLLPENTPVLVPMMPFVLAIPHVPRSWFPAKLKGFPRNIGLNFTRAVHVWHSGLDAGFL